MFFEQTKIFQEGLYRKDMFFFQGSSICLSNRHYYPVRDICLIRKVSATFLNRKVKRLLKPRWFLHPLSVTRLDNPLSALYPENFVEKYEQSNEIMQF